MVGGPRAVVISFKFHQNRFTGFRAVGVEICLFPLHCPVAYTTACINSLYISRNKSIFSKKDIYAYLASRAAENRHGRLCSAADSHFNDSCLSDQLSQHLLDRSSPNFQGWYDCR